MPPARSISSLMFVVALAACSPSDDDNVPCATAESIAACADAGAAMPFQKLYDTVIQPSCGRSGYSCHAPEGAQGGLAFNNPQSSYQTLTNTNSVRVHDVACSPLVKRIVNDDPRVRMPPATPLSQADRCALIRWVEGGAKFE